MSIRDATREDLAALQQAEEIRTMWETAPTAAPEILHKGCGGRISYLTGLDDRYTCNGIDHTFGACGLSYLVSRVNGWNDEDVATTFQVREAADERVYKLELNVARKAEYGTTTHYRLRVASADETRAYHEGRPNSWKLR